MTAEEILDHNFFFGKESLHTDVTNVMKEYTKQKCQELLEIVVEKAKTKIEYSSAIKGHFYDVIDKDSILNAADLDSFIV